MRLVGNLSPGIASVVCKSSFKMSRTNCVAYVIDCICEDVALLELKRNSSVEKVKKDFANVLDILFLCLVKDHNVPQVNKCNLSLDD